MNSNRNMDPQIATQIITENKCEIYNNGDIKGTVFNLPELRAIIYENEDGSQRRLFLEVEDPDNWGLAEEAIK